MRFHPLPAAPAHDVRKAFLLIHAEPRSFDVQRFQGYLVQRRLLLGHRLPQSYPLLNHILPRVVLLALLLNAAQLVLHLFGCVKRLALRFVICSLSPQMIAVTLPVPRRPRARALF